MIQKIHNLSIYTLSIVCLTFLFSCEKNKTPDDPKSIGRPVTETSSKWISQVLEYVPAPGQFINNSTWGTPERAQELVGKKAGISLGTYGGYVVFMFDHTVQNIEGPDFVIHGNAFAGSSEQGAVMVAFDKNGNGKPDQEEWYELKGSEYDQQTTIKDYAVTYQKPEDGSRTINWTDNQGGSGTITGNWPNFPEGAVPQTLVMKGNKVVTTGVNNIFEWGYADNFSTDYNETVNGDPDTAGSNKFDISNAIDSEGNPVQLSGVDFIKVYTCVFFENPPFGEVSPEVCGAISLSVK